jgi:hypothetical protein
MEMTPQQPVPSVDPASQTPHRPRPPRRDRSMWGCLRTLAFLSAAVLIILSIAIGGGWYYLGTASFADLVRLRVEKSLESHLGRNVSIGSVRIVASRPRKVILDDVRIANAPGALQPYFATARQVEIALSIDSFWGRRVRVGRVDIRDPRLNIEIFPDGAPLTHNFPHWLSGPKGRYEIVHIDLRAMNVTGGLVDFNDRRHQIRVISGDLRSTIEGSSRKGIYQGIAHTPSVRVQIQDYLPMELKMDGGFRYTPGELALHSVALRGPGTEALVSGKIAPLAKGVYDLRITSRVALERVREVFRVQKTLQGLVQVDGNLRGRQGDFTLTGGFFAPRLKADVYELAQARGRFNVNGKQTTVDVQTAGYGGGTISAHYLLVRYAEPYPMEVDLRYRGVSIEKLFADWGVGETGLRGGGTGELHYGWNKDRLLEGSGEGTARLTSNSAVFSRAKYPIPIGGSADFALRNGVITFGGARVDTGVTRADFSGTLRISDLRAALMVYIDSSDLGQLDRIGYNLAHSAGKKAYDVLGLGGQGQIRADVQGRLKEPIVKARIAGTAAHYGNVLLGTADLDLRYDGPRSVLSFDRALFTQGGSTLALTGTMEFPDHGPSPRFDMAVETRGYSVDRAIAAVNLKLAISGAGTGGLTVAGTPDEGLVRFAGMTIREGASELLLNGDVGWAPGKGNVSFELAIGAQSVPIADIVRFLDLGTLPVSGELTGTLHLQGPKNTLEGAGALSVRNGAIYGEPVDTASAGILFTHGRLKATDVRLTAPAGTATGEAELDLSTNSFSYMINSPGLDLLKIKLLSQVRNVVGGTVTLTSSGAGSPEQPELMVEMTLTNGVFSGVPLPPNTPAPKVYLAIHDRRLVVRGSAFNALDINGDGTISQSGDLEGLITINVSDISRALEIFSAASALPATGKAVVELRLGGKTTSLEALRIEGTVPVLDLHVSEREFRAERPLHLTLAGGRLAFDSFQLRRGDSIFSISGYADLTGSRALNMDVRGEIEAAIAQLFVTGLKADGHANLIASIRGTMASPRINGSAEVQDAQVKVPGFPQIIDHISGTVLFKGDRLDIESLRAQLGGGTVVLGGYITLQGLTPRQVRITIQGSDVALRYFEGISVEGDFKLLLSGDSERMVLSGDVDVARGLYFRDFDFRTSLLNLILSRKGIVPTVAASWQGRVSLRLHLNAPGTLAVRNNVADVTGTADLDLTGTLSNPVVLGLVTMDEGGRIRFQNVDYRVVRGSINFQNPFRIDPYFDMTMEGRVSGGYTGFEGTGQYDVTVNVTGTLDRITPTITSDPPASDITLFSVLGVGALGPNRGQSGVAVGTDTLGLGRSLLEQNLIGMLGSKILPFADSFTYDPGLLSTTTGSGPKVTIEKRVSNDLRVIVVYFLTHESRDLEIVEWQITPEWVIQLTRDSASKAFLVNAIDARFRRRYEGRSR